MQEAVRVLLVDDNQEVCDVLREMLEANGFAVLVSKDGLSALNVIETYCSYIDILLTDIRMPQMGGPELAKRAKLLRPEMKVLFMSGDASEALASGELDSAAMILAKPFGWSILAGKVRDALGQENTRRRVFTAVE